MLARDVYIPSRQREGVHDGAIIYVEFILNVGVLGVFRNFVTDLVHIGSQFGSSRIELLFDLLVFWTRPRMFGWADIKPVNCLAPVAGLVLQAARDIITAAKNGVLQMRIKAVQSVVIMLRILILFLIAANCFINAAYAENVPACPRAIFRNCAGPAWSTLRL